MPKPALLGTVGEPINPEAWMWYRGSHQATTAARSRTLGGRRNGAHHDRPDSGAIATKPGSATRPVPGRYADVVTTDGHAGAARVWRISGSEEAVARMARTIYGDPDRYVKQYWSQIPGMYFTGDGARKDKDGYFWIMGGGWTDVLNVSGHRLSTMEVEFSTGGA